MKALPGNAGLSPRALPLMTLGGRWGLVARDGWGAGKSHPSHFAGGKPESLLLGKLAQGPQPAPPRPAGDWMWPCAPSTGRQAGLAGWPL